MDIVSGSRWEQEGRIWIEILGEVATPRRVLPDGKPFLVEIDGRRQRAVRVRDVERVGAGSIVVPVAELVDAAPLTFAEVGRYEALDIELAGKARIDQRKSREFMGLLHRWRLFGTYNSPAEVAA